mgnify:CR=1 FL=1
MPSWGAAAAAMKEIGQEHAATSAPNESEEEAKQKWLAKLCATSAGLDPPCAASGLHLSSPRLALSWPPTLALTQIRDRTNVCVALAATRLCGARRPPR